MSRYLYKLLLILVAVSFSISASEMDIGKCKNSFFDDGDTYVRTEQVSFDHISNDRFVHQAPCLLDGGFYNFQHPETQEYIPAFHLVKNSNAPPPKLYLLNAVLII